jgi:hypothetical protein
MFVLPQYSDNVTMLWTPGWLFLLCVSESGSSPCGQGTSVPFDLAHTKVGLPGLLDGFAKGSSREVLNGGANRTNQWWGHSPASISGALALDLYRTQKFRCDLNLVIITFNAVDDTSNRNSKFSNILESIQITILIIIIDG